MGSILNRSFVSMDPDTRSFYASIGGHKSGGNFAKDHARASAAGRMGAANQPLSAKKRGGLNSHRNRG